MSNLFEHSRAGVSKTKLKIRISRVQSKIYFPKRTNAANCPIKDFNDLKVLIIYLNSAAAIFIIVFCIFVSFYATTRNR